MTAVGTVAHLGVDLAQLGYAKYSAELKQLHYETKQLLYDLCAFPRILPLIYNTDSESTLVYALGALQNLCTRREYALHMRDEVKVQSAMVDEITHKVDSAGAHLSNLNKKMKKTLAQTRSADRFILDFILLVVLLAIIGYIISMVTGTGR